MRKMTAMRLVVVVLALWGSTTGNNFCLLKTKNQCSAIDPLTSDCRCTSSFMHRELCCDFNGTSAAIEEISVLFFSDVVVINAKTFVFHPECLYKQNITFVNIEHGAFMRSTFRPLTCPVNVHLISSSFESFFAIKSLQMFNSSVNIIEWSKDFDQFRMKRSSVVTLRNVSLLNPTYRLKECFTTQDSVIGTASDLRMTCEMVMDNSVVKLLQAAVIYQSRITSSILGTVSSNGLVLMKGWHRMRNVTFFHLAEEALIFSSEAEVLMKNVTIAECIKPCIKIEGSLVYASGVSINGELVPNFLSSDYVRMAPSHEFQMVDPSDFVCAGTEQSRICNLYLYQGLPVIFTPYGTYKDIVLFRHDDVGVISSCNVSLKFLNVVGYLREQGSFDASTILHSKSVPDDLADKQCSGGQSNYLHVENSQLRFIHASVLLGIRSMRSAIGIIEVEDPIYSLNFVDSYIHSIENLIYEKSPTSEFQFFMQNVVVSSIYHLYLGSGATFINVNVQSKIVNLTIAHEVPSNTTVIKHSVINEVYTNGITIVRGVLVLDNVVIRLLQPGAINVENDASLLVLAPENITSFICSGAGASIIVNSRSQIIFGGAPTPPWLWFCTTVRPNATFTSEKKPGYVVIHPNLCVLILIAVHFTCDISNEENVIFGGNNYFDDVESVSLHTGRHLIVREHCLSEILIESVLHVTFEKMANSCFHIITLLNSTADKIWNNVMSFNVSNSFVTDLVPESNISNAILQTSHIKTLKLTASFGNFREVTLQTIESLTVQQNVLLEHAILGTISASSMTVQKQGVLSLTQCSIKILNARSITVYGKLDISNTIIEKAFNGSIVVHPDAFIRMHNVTVASNVPHLFVMEGQKFFELGDLKVNSENVYIFKMLKLVNKINNSNTNTLVAQYQGNLDRSSENLGAIITDESATTRIVTSGGQLAPPTRVKTEESANTTLSTPSKAVRVVDSSEPATAAQDKANKSTREPDARIKPPDATEMKVQAQSDIMRAGISSSTKLKNGWVSLRQGTDSMIPYTTLGVAMIAFCVFYFTKWKLARNSEPVVNGEVSMNQVSHNAGTSSSPRTFSSAGNPQELHNSTVQPAHTTPGCPREPTANDYDDSSLIVSDKKSLLT